MAQPKVRNDATTRARALHELGVDVPYYACRLVRNRLEFHLYGGRVVTWAPPAPKRRSQPRARPKPEPEAEPQAAPGADDEEPAP